MAQWRMFNKSIIDSAKFLKMPSSSQLLYFHLGMRADDDGVVEAFNVLRMTGLNEDDLRVLISKEYVVLLNDDLVSYIVDWRKNNKLRADRKVDSEYKELLIKVVPNVELLVSKRKSQTNDNQMSDNRQSNDNQMSGIEENRIEENNNIYSDIFDLWISKKIKKHREISPTIKKAIDKAMKEYSKDEILEAINNYGEMLNSDYEYCNYKWGLDDFLVKTDKDRTRQLPKFLNDGSKYLNYLEWKTKIKNNTDDLLEKYT